MCYGSGCSFEDHMGGCIVINDYKWIRTELGFESCFMGGIASGPEEDEYYEELANQGKINEMRNIIYECKQERLNIYKNIIR